MSGAGSFMRFLQRAVAPRAREACAPRRMNLEEVEPRILHSADLAPFVAADVGAAQIEMRVVESPPIAQMPATQQDQRRHELVIVDSAIADYQKLVDDILANADETRDIDVVVLRPGDGVMRVTDALAGRSDIDALHIISHGKDGVVYLGRDTLDLAGIAARREELQRWGAALDANADILIYGCDVAETQNGRAMLQELASLTGADVAASVDATGASQLGGDWDLEYRAGAIETFSAVGAGAQWQGVLGSAPVLSGANPLASIPEDAATNDGTTVADLILGQVTDADPGALQGIAVTAVDNTNGTWQYSLDGSTWTAIPVVSSNAALLLDASSKVRFVAAANWNGTLASGITFRAWDQTSGSAGGFADTTSVSRNVRDNFTTVAYNRDDGSASWNGSWIDSDGSASGGRIFVSGGVLRFDGSVTATTTIEREVDLANATSATLTFDYANTLGTASLDLRVSSNGGTSWTTLTSSFGSSGTASFNLLPYASANTRIQFVLHGETGVLGVVLAGGDFQADNVQIAFVKSLNGGSTAFSSATASAGITVLPVNDAPSGTSATISMLEDSVRVLAAADFGYSDPVEGDALKAVKIASLPAAGSLLLDGSPVNLGDFVTAAELAANKLVYAPAANVSGTAYASFTFQVQDTGGVANGGVDLDPTPKTLTFDVTAVNDAPASANAAVSALEDTPYVFQTADFPFGDAADGGAHTLDAVKIASLPAAGTLRVNGSAVTAGQFVSAADIAAGKLVYTPAADANGAGYASFTFQVRDSGGTANGGVDLDPAARTMTIDVAAVNDAPSGAAKTVTALQDTPFVFSTADFGFSDPRDSNVLLAVRVGTPPLAGALTLDGIAVTAGQFVSAADIAAGKLAYLAPLKAWGAGYANFTFQVQDDGGTANGGVDLDPTSRLMTISVTDVQDAPVLSGANDLASINEDATGNGGTLVSSLVSGRVFDNDGGALSGIAVTAWDNTNGAWQYSTNGGSVWTSFASMPAGSARLLAADASTYVRFVPNANFNGTVADGLTFRAWDRTTGIAGGVATTLANPTYRDSFGSVSYSNNDGTGAWAGSWIDGDGSASGGRIKVTGGELEIRANGSESIYREVDLSAATTATLSFAYRNTIAGGDPTVIAIQVSNNGGSSYATLASFASASLTGSGTYSADLTPYLSANTRVRFNITTISSPPQSVFIDDLQIATTGGGVGGASAFSAATASSSLVVNPVNDAPAGASNTVTTNEDTAFVFTAANFGFTDTIDGNALAAVKITTLPGAGSLKLNGAAVTAGQFVSAANIAAGKLVYTPAANANGTGYASFTFQVQDDGGTANGGVDLDPTARTMTVNVTAVNDAPTGTNNTVTTNEDTTFVFTTAHFGFADAVEGNALSAVKITTLPTAGTLALNGVAVTAGQFVSAANIAAGKLVYTPAANANGTGYASFTFQVQDDGGTANGGVDLDPTARTMTVNVTPVNDAPAGANNTVTTLEDTAFVFTAANFGFSDTADGNALLAVKIASLPAAGTLALNGTAVTAGQFVSAANIAAGKLVYTPAANANGTGYASFTFQVQDDGGTANGGVDLDPTARTMTVNVTAVNDAPTGTNNTVTTNEDTTFVFTTAHFGFADATDSSAHALKAVKIAALPTAGTLALNGVAVTAGQFVTAIDIAAGKLKYTPAANANGAAYASFTFQVQDDGGTANGGVDLDSTARTMTVNVTSVNDAPRGTSATVTTLEDTAFVFTAANFGFSDTADGNALLAVKIASLPAAGTLALNGTAVTAGQFVSAANIAAGKLVYTPAANANGTGYASFTFQVQDDGGTANGGVDLDPTARTMTVNVTAVNDAPTGTNNTVTTNEDTTFVFTTAHFGFADATDSSAHSLKAVKIATLPTAGTLALSGVAVTAGQFVTAGDIAAGKLKFTPAPDANGTGYASFTFQVQDDGGTANGGVDLDATARTMTVDVTPVQDAPTLTGANNLTAINEDAAGNSGTLVSSLIAGRFGDVDAGALSGIAVIAVDNTLGTWQYSIDGGTSWSDFGVVASGSARLLASDARVRFVPDANWNGTVTNGITFHAWDRTSGVNGGVAPTIANPVFQDNFSTISYSNNDGTAVWSGSWVDSDNDPAGGRIRVRNGLLEIGTKSVGNIYRELDLSGTTAATLSFTFINGLDSGDDSVVAVQVSSNGGASYTTLGTFSRSSFTGAGTAYADISAFRSDNTRIRFAVTTADNKAGNLYIGTIQVSATAPAVGGSSAFSATTASSGVTVLPVNDAPAGANKTVTTLEDTGYVFATADFGFSDATDAASNSGANALNAVRITTVPTAGALRLNGVAVTAGQFVSAADIAAGKLVFAPGADASGNTYATFTFQVQDNGGTANGGVDLAPTAATMTIKVTEVNDAPVGTATTQAVLEDGSYVFSQASFGFTDPRDTPSDKLKAVKITTLPTAGTLTLKGAAVTAGQLVTAADLSAGNLVFRPAANANGAGYAGFTFQVQDNGGTANGGVDLDPVARLFTFDVTAVNDAPRGADKTVTLLEDTTRAFALADFGFADATDGNAFFAVKLVTVPSAGSLTLNGVAVTAGQSIAAADIAAGKLTFRAASNANGAGYAAFTFRVQDDGGTANGGVDTDPLARTLRIDVTPVNDAPRGSDTSVGTLENRPFVFSTSAFGFSDPRDGNAFLAVKIGSLPAAGSLTLSGAAVVTGQVVSAADIAAGKLVYAPPANQSGPGVGRFTFQVQDDGGTANGGIDLDPTANTLTIDVGAINHAPTGTDATVQLDEDGRFVFGAATFGFSDTNDVMLNNFLAVRITTLPTAGTLTLGGTAVAAGQFVSVADLAAGRLAYAPAANANGNAYASFTFQVQDDGGTANGGADLDESENTITFNVRPVNDAPTGADRTTRIDEDTTYTFAVSDFGYADAADGNAFAAVRIAALPVGGALRLDGVAVTSGQTIAASDIAAGKLVYAPPANANGIAYARFTFQVQDDGGTANGGSDLDAIARTFTFDVTPVNDAPAGTSAAVTMGEDGRLVLNAAAFGFTDPADVPANALKAVTITTLPTTGTLALNGVAVAAGQSIVAADLAAGRLVYTPLANESGAAYASFGFVVQDDGGGADTDPTERFLTINVVPVNDAPSGADATLATNEDTAIVVPGAAFGFRDALEGNGFLAVKIASLPGAGSLTLNGVAVAAGQFVSAADIAAGKLVYTPGANGNGAGYASFTFQVQDDGGTANGGIDLDPVAHRVSFDVAAVDDTPTGRGSTVTLSQDSSVTLGVANFGFSDSADSPAPHAFVGVHITATPGSGALTLGGTAITTNQFVSVADLNAGRLVYTPAASGNAAIGFRVQDSGAAGLNVDTIARTLSLNVTPRAAPIVVETPPPPVMPVAPPPATVTQPTVQTISQTSPSSTSSSGSTSSSSSSSSSGSSSSSSSSTSSSDKPASGTTQSAGKTVEQGAAQRAAADAAAGAAAPGAGGAAGVAGAPTGPGGAAQIAIGATEVRPIEATVQGVGGGVQRLDSQVRSETRNAFGAAFNVVSDAPLLLAQVQQGDTLSDLGKAFGLTQSSSSSASALAAANEQHRLVQQLDEVRDAVREQQRLEASTVAASASAAVSLSVGYVVWLLRGGVLVSTFLSAMPAWRLVDPLPILERLDEEGSEDDDSLESLVARNNMEAAEGEAPAEPGALKVEAV